MSGNNDNGDDMTTTTPDATSQLSLVEPTYEERLESARRRRDELRRRVIPLLKELERVNGFIGYATARLEAERDNSDDAGRR